MSTKETEDIFIAKKEIVIEKLINPYQERVETAESLFGVLPKHVDLDEARTERLNKNS